MLPVIAATLREILTSMSRVRADNRVNQMLIHKFMKKLGHHTTIVDNGLDAVNALDTGKFDCVLMDVHMPVCTRGLAAFRITISTADQVQNMLESTSLRRMRSIYVFDMSIFWS
jgi:CheY-like chemotaxis protein